MFLVKIGGQEKESRDLFQFLRRETDKIPWTKDNDADRQLLVTYCKENYGIEFYSEPGSSNKFSHIMFKNRGHWDMFKLKYSEYLCS